MWYVVSCTSNASNPFLGAEPSRMIAAANMNSTSRIRSRANHSNIAGVGLALQTDRVAAPHSNRITGLYLKNRTGTHGRSRHRLIFIFLFHEVQAQRTVHTLRVVFQENSGKSVTAELGLFTPLRHNANLFFVVAVADMPSDAERLCNLRELFCADSRSAFLLFCGVGVARGVVCETAELRPVAHSARFVGVRCGSGEARWRAWLGELACRAYGWGFDVEVEV